MSPNYGLRLEKCSLKECLPKKSLEVAQFLAFIQQRQLSCTTYFIFVNCNHYDVGIHNRNLQNPLKKKIYAACTIIIITLVVYLLFLHIYECYAKNPIVYKWVHYILPWEERLPFAEKISAFTMFDFGNFALNCKDRLLSKFFSIIWNKTKCVYWQRSSFMLRVRFGNNFTLCSEVSSKLIIFK